ncbi:MAG TPA: ATP-binding protein [Rectinema sp.]|jgi:DNA replication protein DnaC|nr:ATP-binding protein [Rectinema sp.]HQJ23296.1 ATP-binding protein [Rectinema sp.]
MNGLKLMGDPVVTTALLDRILENALCFYLRGGSYRLKDKTITKEEKEPVKE